MGTQPGTAADAPPAATVDLTDHGFSRIASGPSPFIDAAAFLLISGGMNVPEEYLAVFDATRPAFHGKDHVQRPLMLVMGGNDMISDASGDLPADGTPPFNPAEAQWMNPITKAYGQNDAPAYGVVIDGANHITAVSELWNIPSWDFGTLWNYLAPKLLDITGPDTKVLMDPEDCTYEERMALKNNIIADVAIFFFQGIFPSNLVVDESDEKLRLEELQSYTSKFWNVYLSPRYDEINSGAGKAFLQRSDEVHMNSFWVMNDYGFRRSSPGAFVVRDSAGSELVQFQNDGHVLTLKGTVTTGATISQTTAKEFIIRDSSGNIAAKVDASTGNLYLKGSVSECEPVLQVSTSPEFVVRDAVEIAQTGNANNARIILDADGNLELKGHLNPLP